MLLEIMLPAFELRRRDRSTRETLFHHKTISKTGTAILPENTAPAFQVRRRDKSTRETGASTNKRLKL